ncbi:DEAD/DEAH box helicase [Aquabacterium sp.]|uniref:DEAD/DEAH box helicase n=1 Tax=Aquabacterium sp. TaxID=1872578 RepID=UPI002E322B32|nr:DEAD/DEAH box helicase [Aquabacterium sp.]HEX5310441.1 DEAD/DEAH box helicase [Aquabacterium sp.]
MNTEIDTPRNFDDAVEVDDGAVKFDDLGLSPELCRALADSGYTHPTTVQVQAIPAAMNGSDLRVASSTGSGKTAAFMLPCLERIVSARGDNTKRREKGKVHGPRVLVLAPTRELAMQVAKAAQTYGKHLQGLRVATVVGGVPYGAQLKALKGPLDVLIATPGRLLDHMNTGAAVLSNLETLVLDEADRMLDMGFIDDIEAIAEATPENRQTLMFSATFAGHVGELAERLTQNAVRIEVASHTDSHDNIEQRLHLADTLAHKNDLLDSLLTTKEVDQAVVFTSTQRDADVLADRLADMGHAVAALHGGMPQGRRNRVLQALRNRQLRVLVATDVAARGIDVPTITHVINYGMPMKAEDYVHRIGRTGRAGRSGLAVTLVERRDIPMLRRIERFTTQRIPEAVIEGLEPKTKLAAERGGPRRDKPGFGPRRDDRGSRFGGRRDDFGQGDRFQDREAPRSFARGEGRPEQGGERGEFGRFGSDRPKRPFADQPFGKKPFGARGDRPQGDRPFGDRPFGDRGFQDRGERSFGGDRPQQDRPFGDRPFADRAPRGDRPAFGDKPFGQRPGNKFGGKPFGQRDGQREDRGQGERSFGGDKPFGGKPFGGKPSFGAKPGFNKGPKPGFGGGKRGGFARRED